MNLDVLPSKSPQEVFDYVSTHLLAQMFKSERLAVSHEGHIHPYCLYRSDEGRCAAGCLIGDEEYSHEIEGNDWITLVSWGYAPDEHKYLIRDLQVIHDCVDTDKWSESLMDLAVRYELTM